MGRCGSSRGLRVFLGNPPWFDPGRPDLWGVRAGSRWPHWQTRGTGGEPPRYLPFPFFLAIAAGGLRRDGHEVKLVDGVAEGMAAAEFARLAAEFAPDLVFLETSTPSFDHDMELVAAVKKLLPSAFLVLGGAHDFADSAGAEFAGDAWIVGEYELLLARLAAHIAAAGSPPDGGAPGFEGFYRGGGGGAGRARIGELDKLAPPLFEQLPMRRYSDPVCGLPTPNAHSWLSRGCPYACSFCVWPQVVYGGRDYRRRSIAAALDEVELLISQYACESFYFDDDTANIGEPRMLELAAAIRRRQLDQYPWAMMARADCMTPAALEALAAAGMYAVKYGVESVSPSLVDACGKGTNLERLLATIEETRALGIKQHLTFTFGLPGETPETMWETLEFAERVAPESAQFSICTPFPGTQFHRECVERGWLVDTDWRHYVGSELAVVSTPQLSANELSTNFAGISARWRRFLEERSHRRRQRLGEEIAAVAASGGVLEFHGDADFAAEVREGAPLATPGIEATAVLIVSRHDEEKIFRRLRRADALADKPVLRLYHD